MTTVGNESQQPDQGVEDDDLLAAFEDLEPAQTIDFANEMPPEPAEQPGPAAPPATSAPLPPRPPSPRSPSIPPPPPPVAPAPHAAPPSPPLPQPVAPPVQPLPTSYTSALPPPPVPAPPSREEATALEQWEDEDLTVESAVGLDRDDDHEVRAGFSTAHAPLPAPYPNVADDDVTVIARPSQQLLEHAGGHASADPTAHRSRARSPATMAAVGATAMLVMGVVVFGPFGASEPASLVLEAEPADAVVKVDGKVVDAAGNPKVVEGLDPSTTHRVQLTKDGYGQWETVVDIAEGERLELPKIVLEPVDVATGFAADTEPSGAKVYVDGRLLEQTTPVRVTDLEPGTHQLRFEADGYEPHTVHLAVSRGRVTELNTAVLGKATVEPEPEDDAPAAVAAETRTRRDARKPAARKRARPARRAARSSRATGTKRAQQSAKSTPANKGGPGTLRVNSQPWSRVFVNDRFVGNTPQFDIRLPAGRHTVKLVNKKFGVSKTLRVKMAPGKTVTRIVELMPD